MSTPERKLFKLSVEQYNALKMLDADIAHAKVEIRRAEDVGLDVTELKKRLADAIKLRDSVMKEYKPEGV